MKTQHSLKVLAFGLALVSFSAGCRLAGDGSRPTIASVEPGEGPSGAAVTVILENFDDLRDMLLFGGVPVRPSDAGDSGNKATRIVKVPKLGGGDVPVTVRRGLYESDAVLFTILPPSNDDPIDPSGGGATTAGATAGSTTTGGTTGGGGNTTGGTTTGDGTTTSGGGTTGETTASGTTSGATTGAGNTTGGESTTGGTATGGATTGGTTGGETTEGGTAGGTTGPSEPPPTPAAVVELSEGNFIYGLNYVKLNWSVTNVASAFIRVPVKESYRNTIPYGQFQGDAYYPNPYGIHSDEAGLLETLSTSLFDEDFGDLPFSYCQVGAKGREPISWPCYDPNPNQTQDNFIDVVIPLVVGETSKAGTWKFELPAAYNTFTIYYRDWAENVRHESVTIQDPLIPPP